MHRQFARFGSWLRGTGPAAILLQNDTDGPLGFKVCFLRHSDRIGPPLTLYLQEGDRIGSFRFETPRAKIVSLKPIAASREELILIWTDSCSLLASIGRTCLSVRLVDIKESGSGRDTEQQSKSADTRQTRLRPCPSSEASAAGLR